MRITTRLLLLGSFSLVLTLGVWSGFRWSEAQVAQALARAEYADRIQALVSDLQVHLHHVAENPHAQSPAIAAWRDSRRALAGLLSAPPILDAAQQAALHAIRAHHAATVELFDQVIERDRSAGQRARAPGGDADATIKAPLHGQLSAMLDQCARLVTRTHEGIGNALVRGRTLLVALLLAMSGLFILAALGVALGIRTQIAGLQKGLQRVAEGNHEYTIGDDGADELGELARRFDAMTKCLRDTTVRRAELESLVKQRTLEVQRANRELQRSNDELQQFAHVASHDLQEPLRVLVSFSDLLSQRYADSLDDDAREFMAHMSDSARRMRKMIQDLLEYAWVQTRGQEPRPVNMNLAAAQALGNLHLAVRDAAVRVRIADLPEARGDPGQLLRLLQNLIGNAVKYRAKQDPWVEVSGEKTPHGCRFLVRDNGIGIAPAHQARIFNIFQRLHTREEYPGTGIGLAICKRIVERHGGRLWVESTPGQGSCFYFTLPE